MQTQELVEKEKEDEQWNRYNENRQKAASSKASPRQIAYIVDLAKGVGLRIDASRIDSSVKASSLIEKLKTLNRLKNPYSAAMEQRDKKVAFGMATKLVFKKYMDKNREYRKSKRFWKEVSELYCQYSKEQDKAVKGFIPC